MMWVEKVKSATFYRVRCDGEVVSQPLSLPVARRLSAVEELIAVAVALLEGREGLEPMAFEALVKAGVRRLERRTCVRVPEAVE